MTQHDSALLAIRAAAGAAPLSAAQKRFNTLIERIDKEREVLAAWQEVLPRYEEKRVATVQPLLDASDLVELDLLRHLDRCSDAARLGRNDMATLREVICVIGESLLDGAHDAEVTAIIERHRDPDTMLDADEEAELLSLMSETMFGVPLSREEAAGSHDDIERLLRERLDAQHEEHRQAHGERRRSAAELRAQQASEEATLQVRELYRKLASALHPDREPDEDARERKTALMQRVNRAWQDRNLLDLLQLQLEIEQLGAPAPGQMADAKLARFNKVLARQLDDLRAENEQIEARFRHGLQLDGQRRIRPREVLQHLTRSAQRLQANIRARRRELAMLANPKSLKAWLRDQRDALDAFDFDGMDDDPFR